MIKEDYVSFEIAKLLKEKGFDGCATSFLENGNMFPTCIVKRKEHYPAPTLQMAMKWLREVCKCYIHIAPFYQHVDYSKPPKWLVAVDANCIPYPTLNNEFKTYEDACEAAIKYCLEIL